MMKKTKTIFCFLLLWAVLLTVFFIPVFGAEESDGENRVFDGAALFSPEEIAGLQEEAVRMKKEHKAEFIVLTVDHTGGRSSQETADEYFFSHGYEKSFGEDGAVVLIDMDNREIYLGTYGIIIRVITDKRREAVLDAAYPYALEERYADVALTMLKECERYIQKGIVAGQYNYDAETGKIQVHHTIRWYEALAAFAVSALLAVLACQGVCASYRMKAKKGAKSQDEAENILFCLEPSSDLLINTAVHHTIIRHQQSGGRSSGGSSSRRSTTHSYHGHSAGGGGRKF